MFKIKKNIVLDLTNINNTINEIESLKKQFISLKDELEIAIDYYMKWLLTEVKKRSLSYIDSEDTFFPSQLSDIRKNINSTINFEKNGNFTYTLWYNSEVCSFLEFGTGLVGKANPHPMANQTPKYNYASGEVVSTKGYWKWLIPEEYRRTVITPNGKIYEQEYMATKGYEGRKFIYKAFRDIIDNELHIKYYEQIVGHIFKRNIK